MTNSIAIANIEIRQDDAGRYSLNDMHRAAGSESRHQPANWLRQQQVQDLVSEIEMEIPHIRGIQSKQGLGTFVCKELVYSYAMWVSPKFHLRVIRVFDSASQAVTAPTTLTGALRLALEQAEQIERQNALIEYQKPAVEFALTVRNTDDAISIKEAAKYIGTGQNRLFAALRNDRILMRDNTPYQSFIDRGYFRVIENVYKDRDGASRVTPQTLVTGKGQVWIQRRYAPGMQINA